MGPLRLDHATLTQPGTYAVNEDAAGHAASQGLTLLGVADGLGGHEIGDRASRLAIDRAVELFTQRPSLDAGDLTETVIEAHRALRSAEATGSGPLTTLVLLASDSVTARWAHVGDSRLYLFRDEAIDTRTRDHSVPEMLRRVGEISDEDIRHHPDRSRLLHALGQEADPRVAVSDAYELRGGDAFLLCTDGWWEALSDQEMEQSLRDAASPQEWLATMAAAIRAATRTPQDNYTAVAAFVASDAD